jgi:hypothetical protein
MEQVITGKFDVLSQAEGAATKLRTIRANEVEISEWNGSSSMDAERSTGVDGVGTTMFAYNPNNSGVGGISGGAAGIGGGFSSSGPSFFPYMGNDDYSKDTNQMYLLHALVQDEQRDKAIRIIREAGGREF